MKKIIWVIVIIALIVLVWYAASNQPTTAPSPEATSTAQTTAPAVVTVSTDPTLGQYLVASNGITLYAYTKDAPRQSTCTGQCAAAWPPYVIAAGEPLSAGTGVSGKLATITRTDGSTQLTYNDLPVYFFQKDSKPGDTTGQGVGNVWYVVKP